MYSFNSRNLIELTTEMRDGIGHSVYLCLPVIATLALTPSFSQLQNQKEAKMPVKSSKIQNVWFWKEQVRLSPSPWICLPRYSTEILLSSGEGKCRSSFPVFRFQIKDAKLQIGDSFCGEILVICTTISLHSLLANLSNGIGIGVHCVIDNVVKYPQRKQTVWLVCLYY